MRVALATLVASQFLAISSALGQSASRPPAVPAVTVDRRTAGTMKTVLSATIAVNENSTLPREAITIHSRTIPLELPQSVAIGTRYGNREYQYSTSFSVVPKDTLAAIEIRFLLFDVFGDRVRTLSLTEVSDMTPGVAVLLDPSWRVWSENETAEYYASIAFVARVRTRSGRVIEANLAPILEEARRFSRKFTEADLSADAERRP